MPVETYDVAIIGGGINGAGIAADAAGRGLSVCLLEKNDLASATSSASSKLIHGGLRYLEHYEFRLVRESLREREVLLAKAPHIIWPLRFVLPHTEGMRSHMLMRLGLHLYDYLVLRSKIPSSQALDLSRDPSGRALQNKFTAGFAYWDCWVDDARLVVLNARAAADRGAAVVTRTEVTSFRVEAGAWLLNVRSDCGVRDIRARTLINAAGPWVEQVSRLEVGAPAAAHNGRVPPFKLRLVKGSHIVVPGLAWTDGAYVLQADDSRIVFALPFEGDFTLIGTTEVLFDGNLDDVLPSREEEDYLLAVANHYFVRNLLRTDIVWRFAGVRPLLDDASSELSGVTRDYRLQLAAEDGRPPMLTVLGGKITTYRSLAEKALQHLDPFLPKMGAPWTATSCIPGGDVGDAGLGGYRKELSAAYPGIDAGVLAQLSQRYGTLALDILGDAKVTSDLGRALGGGLTEREVVYVRDHEWAKTAEDVLWRRTKVGMHIAAGDRDSVAEAIAQML